jgi:DNA-binding CsgD family transcriptional regulator
VVALSRSFDVTFKLDIERIIHGFLSNTVRHGYNEVSITFTPPISLTDLPGFKARGALSDTADRTPGQGIHLECKQGHVNCGVLETREAGGAQWYYSIYTSNGARSQVLLFCGTTSPVRRSDIDSRATLIGFSHILHNDICDVVTAAARTSPHPLSAREIDTLRWTADGKTAAEIAQIIGISRRTVESYISNAMKKLGTSTRSAAAVKAYGLGLLAPRRLTNSTALRAPATGAFTQPRLDLRLTSGRS